MADLLRLILLVPLAYIAAVIAAAVVIAFGAVDTIYGVGSAGTLFVAGFLIVYVGGVSFLPALLGVVVTELFAVRSVIAYLLVTGVFGYVAHLVLPYTGPEVLLERRGLAFAAAGFVAGFTYWLIAGRRAGLARDPTPGEAA